MDFKQAKQFDSMYLTKTGNYNFRFLNIVRDENDEEKIKVFRGVSEKSGEKWAKAQITFEVANGEQTGALITFDVWENGMVNTFAKWVFKSYPDKFKKWNDAINFLVKLQEKYASLKSDKIEVALPTLWKFLEGKIISADVEENSWIKKGEAIRNEKGEWTTIDERRVNYRINGYSFGVAKSSKEIEAKENEDIDLFAEQPGDSKPEKPRPVSKPTPKVEEPIEDDEIDFSEEDDFDLDDVPIAAVEKKAPPKKVSKPVMKVEPNEEPELSDDEFLDSLEESTIEDDEFDFDDIDDDEL